MHKVSNIETKVPEECSFFLWCLFAYFTIKSCLHWSMQPIYEFKLQQQWHICMHKGTFASALSWISLIFCSPRHSPLQNNYTYYKQLFASGSVNIHLVNICKPQRCLGIKYSWMITWPLVNNC